MKNIRNSCVLCKGNINNIFKFNMPVYMGISEDNTENYIEKMKFGRCSTCGEVQLQSLIDIKILYQRNHNNGVIGEIWTNHYKEFAKFIKNDIKNKLILEISDPSAKIAKLSSGFKYWKIIEPNPEEIQIENVKFQKEFFNENTIKENIDVLVHSHLLEHMYEPIEFMKLCNTHLRKDGLMIFSIPNLEYILESGYSPNNVLHFEHTYYINEKVIKHLAESSGFLIINKFHYGNHSIFYKMKKVSSVFDKVPKIELTNLSQKFKKCLSIHIKSIENINKELNKFDNVYIFGSHVSTQFYLSKGIDENKLKGTLDNSPNKIGKLLYGSNLRTYNPMIIQSLNNCAIICSHSGIYYDEIVKQLKEINNNITIL
jgi:hypothetical protein